MRVFIYQNGSRISNENNVSQFIPVATPKSRAKRPRRESCSLTKNEKLSLDFAKMIQKKSSSMSYLKSGYRTGESFFKKNRFSVNPSHLRRPKEGSVNNKSRFQVNEGDYLLYKNFKKVQEKFHKKSALSRKTQFILKNLSVPKLKN